MTGSSLDTDLPAPWDFIPQGCEKQMLLCTSLLAYGVLLQAELTQVLKQMLAGPHPHAQQCNFYILLRKHFLSKRTLND